MTIDLEEIAIALDMFPDWDETMRAEVYHAIDVAPVKPLKNYAKAENYFKGEGYAAWNRIRTYVLVYNSGERWAVTLDEAAGYESAPTKSEILAALERGARMIR